MIDTHEFVDLISQLNDSPKSFLLGKIDSGYTTGKPKVVFDGETSPSTKTYTYLDSYSPKPNDRVVLAQIGNTPVILGAVQNNTTVGGWRDMSGNLVNGFQVYAPTEWSYIGAHKVGDEVFLSGLVIPPATLTLSVTNIFFLPTAYRPKNRNLVFSTIYKTSGVIYPCQINIYPNGAVAVSGTSAAGADWISLDGISFLTNSNKP